MAVGLVMGDHGAGWWSIASSDLELVGDRSCFSASEEPDSGLDEDAGGETEWEFAGGVILDAVLVLLGDIGSFGATKVSVGAFCPNHVLGLLDHFRTMYN